MKKKVTIIGLCLASCLGLTGCGSSQDAVITNLSNQIDYLNNTVNAINRNISDVPNLSTDNSDSRLTGVYQSAKDILTTQKTYKTAITTKNSMIKKAITDKNLKLTDKDKKALIDLTTALSKNTRSLDESRSELIKSATDVSKNYKDSNATTTQISAKVNRLSNCMNSQSSYYKNLLNTLNNIEGILNIDDSSFDYSTLNDKKNDEQTDNSNELQELLYQYLINNLNNNNCPNGTNSPNCNNGTNNNCANGNCNTPLISNENINNCPNGVCPQNTNQVSNEILNNGNGYNNGAYNGYYNGYYNRGITNPSRNTDTYRPLNRNIDTYRPYGPAYTPIQRNGYNVQQVDAEPTRLGSETDIRRNKNPNQVKNSNHHRAHRSVLANEDEKQEVKDILSNKGIEQVKKIDLDKENNQKQTFAGKTNKLDSGLIIELDVNKKIEDLIRNKTKETFNNSNFLSLR